MIVYVDSSVILRRVLHQDGAIEDEDRFAGVVVSALVEVECLRTLDRLRLREHLDDRRVMEWRESVFKLLDGAEVLDVTRSVLRRASHPMPTALGSLDAIHLATALLWRERGENELAFATHDRALATAARASGLAVIGI
jgi:predicted nucleic acid-binding protein